MHRERREVRKNAGEKATSQSFHMLTTLCCGNVSRERASERRAKVRRKEFHREKERNDGNSQARTQRKRGREHGIEDRSGHAGRECHKRSIEIRDCNNLAAAAAHACRCLLVCTRDCYFKPLATLLYLLCLTCETLSFRHWMYSFQWMPCKVSTIVFLFETYCAIVSRSTADLQGCHKFFRLSKLVLDSKSFSYSCVQRILNAIWRIYYECLVLTN
jgi:hypothetical protein